MRFLLLFLSFLSVNAFAFNTNVVNELTLNYSGDILKVNDRNYNLDIGKYNFICTILDNNDSVCVYNKKNYILRTKIENGIFDSNYLKFYEIKYSE